MKGTFKQNDVNDTNVVNMKKKIEEIAQAKYPEINRASNGLVYHVNDMALAQQEAFIAGHSESTKWVDVKDDVLPPFEEKTQIICENGEQYIGYFNGADKYGKYFWFCDNNDYHYPTHWMPLPQPPKD